LKAAILSLVACAAGVAQIYPPGGGYPSGSQYPYPGSRGPTVPGIPIPGKTSKQPKDSKTSKQPAQPLPNFRGKLKQMDARSIALELGDDRVLDFKRTGNTKFFKNGDEVKPPNFAAGDQISVEAQEDLAGYLTAVNVYWEKGASAATAKSGDQGVADTWAKDAPTVPERATERTPPPARRDPDDPGPPTLKRGKPAEPAREHAPEPPPQPAIVNPPPPPAETAAPRPSIPRTDEDAVPFVIRSEDALIRKAAEAALEFTETLPSYVCNEMMARFQSETSPANFQPVDVVSAEVVYENGKEDYRNLAINGKPVKKKIEETGGAWSTGEFGTVLIDLFSPATAADFHFRRDSRTNGVTAKLYEFDVARERSHWMIHAGSQTYNPAYSGSVWIDPKTSRVLRIEMQAKSMPENFPIDHVESATDYDYIRLGGTQQYLLPVHAETLSCQRASNFCAQNKIDFRNYHKYTGESSIKYGDTVKPDK
jgi:hypothetical protein